ncbi:MAG: pyridoxal phosphate-dependent aminotransferase [Myxococcota bacterium]|nr:pyridoxal phosphate-dependent aminotransferase [Myxococcota bacterium]
MPRPGDPKRSFSSSIQAVGGAVFSPLADRIAAHEGPLYPLHVGDTFLEPFVGGRMEDLLSSEHPGMHRYCETRGISPLVDAIVEKVRSENGLAAERENVLVSGGATGGLACAVSALADPGEEVLILAPFWPLIRGIVRSQRAVPVEVPFFDRVGSADEAVAAVEARLSERTVALYVSSPSNPTGRVLPREWLEALATWARRRDLWLLSDEVYEPFVYRGSHFSPGRVAPERTLSVYSFSKAYGMAGNRVGYVVGPEALVAEAAKASVHSFYHAPTAGQLAAEAALREGQPWLEEVRDAYAAAGRDAARVLGVPEPEGSCFLFLDVRPLLHDRNLLEFLEECLEDGLVLAPGSSSGEDYGGWVRMCFTSAPPEQVATAVRLLAKHLGRPTP